MPAIDPALIYSARQAAECLGVSKDIIYGLAREKKIPHKKIGSQIKFLGWQLLKWVEDGD